MKESWQRGCFLKIGKIAFTGVITLLLLSAFSTPFYFTSALLQHFTATTPGKFAPLAPASQQILRYPLSPVKDMQTLDPALVGDLPTTRVANMIFSGLVGLNEALQIQPALAQSWNISADGLQWTFHLRPGLQFNDGTSLTSDDVAYSLNRALQPGTKSPLAQRYLGLLKDTSQLLTGQLSTLIGDSIITPDKHTVILITSKKAAYFLALLTHPVAYIVKRQLIDKYDYDFTDHLNEGGTSGPFQIKLYKHGRGLILTPNPHYYGALPLLQKIIMHFYPDDQTTYQAYLKGIVDVSPIPSNARPGTRQLKNEIRLSPEPMLDYLAMNYMQKPFNNVHIRQAFALAINKDSIAHTIWHDDCMATNHIVPAGMPGYNPLLSGPAGVSKTTGDARRARQVLSQGLHEEGWANSAEIPPIILTYYSSSSASDQEIASMIGMWHDILGITIKANPISFPALFQAISTTANNPHGLQFWATSWMADYPDPQNWTTLHFGQQSDYNTINYGYNNALNNSQQQAIQQQLTEADSNFDQTSRLETYKYAEQQLVNEVAWLPLHQKIDSFLLKPYVAGHNFNAAGLFPVNSWAHIYITKNSQ